jgi:hypothetical protein
MTVETARIRFTALGLFDETQNVPLGDEAVSVTGPCQ